MLHRRTYSQKPGIAESLVVGVVSGSLIFFVILVGLLTAQGNNRFRQLGHTTHDLQRQLQTMRQETKKLAETSDNLQVTNLEVEDDLLINGSLTVRDTTTDKKVIVKNGSIVEGSWQGGPISVQYGGTGIVSYKAGDLIYGNNQGGLSKLPIGSKGQCLVVSNANLPIWSNACQTSDGTSSTSTSAASVTLQNAYDNGSTITTANAQDLTVTLSNTATDPNLLINIASGSTGRFAVQNAGSDVFRVTSSGVTLGTWQGSAIGAAYGGTGLNTASSTGVPTLASGSWSVAANLGPTLGGTGQTTVSSGDLLYGSAANVWSRLAVGTAGQCLIVSGSLPSWGSCAASVTLQNAYDNGSTITTANAQDLTVTLSNTATDPNLLINIASGSTGRFAVQNAGSDVFRVTSSGVMLQQTADSAVTTSPVLLDITSVGAAGELIASSGNQTFAQIAPVINQSGSAGYTALRVNTTETATGTGARTLLALQTGGTNVFNVQASGAVSQANSLTFTGDGGTANFIYGVEQMRGLSSLTVQGNVSSSSNNTAVTLNNVNLRNFTSGTGFQVLVGGTFGPASGTGNFNFFTVQPTINQTGGASGISRGIFINPALTSAADWRALEISSGRVVFAGSPPASTTQSHLGLGEAIASGSASGTFIGINSSSFSGNFVDWQVGGSSRFKIDASGNVAVTGQLAVSSNSAASAPATTLTGTWFSGGTATTTKPHLLIEPSGATSTNWSVNGTGLGINAASGFSGNLLDIQLNGASRFRIDQDGNIIQAGNNPFLYLQKGLTFTGGFKAFEMTATGLTATFNEGFKNLNFRTAASVSGTATGVQFLPGAHTNLTASSEVSDFTFDLNRTIQFNTGALALQRAIRIHAPTYSFVGASTITDAATFFIGGAPVAGTNATITNSYSLWVGGGLSRFDGPIIETPQLLTIANNGTQAPASATLTPTSSYVEITCNDPDGCDVTMGETGIKRGQRVQIINTSTNTVNFADTAGVSELSGNFAAGIEDTITMIYRADRWVELSRSNN